MRSLQEIEKYCYSRKLKGVVPQIPVLFSALKNLLAHYDENQLIDLLENISNAIDFYVDWLVSNKVQELEQEYRCMDKRDWDNPLNRYFADPDHPDIWQIEIDYDIPTRENTSDLDLIDMYLSELTAYSFDFNLLEYHQLYEIYAGIAYGILDEICDFVDANKADLIFDKVLSGFVILHFTEQEYYKNLIENQELKNKIEIEQVEQKTLSRNARCAANQKHLGNRQRKANAITHFLSEKQNGISKNQFSKQYASQYHVTEKTLREWLKNCEYPF